MDKLSSENKFAIMPEWVIELDVSHTAFRLYAVLARYADNITHQAFPSLDTLSKRLGCSEKTVRRAIEDLVKHGAIKKHSRGRYHSTLYTVITSSPKGTKMSGEWTKMSEEGTKMSQRVDKNDQVTRTNQLEPLEREPKNYIEEQFNQFWSVYPKKVDKPLAKRSFEKALKRASLEVIVDGAERYRDDPNRDSEFTKNPSTWLNADAWENESLPARAAKMTNSARNLDNFKKKIAMLQAEPMKEVEHEQAGNRSAIDFGINFRSTDSV